MRRLISWLYRLLSGDMPKKNDESARELLEELRHLRQEIKELKESIMIAQATFDASLTGLTTAVSNAAAALAAGQSGTSTPDTVVSAFLSGVAAQTVTLATATPPVPAPTPVALK